MQRRRLLAALAMVLVLGGFFAWTHRVRDPEYNGKRLSQWLTEYLYAGDEADLSAASTAIRHIGTNGIPWMLRSLRHEHRSNKLSRALLQKLPRKLRFNSALNQFLNRPDADLAGAAEVGLCLLGSSATNAVPALTRMMRNYSATNASLASIRVLGCIGPGGLPSLSAALTNSLFPFRHVVAAAIGMNFQAHTQVIPALPLLFACATNGNEQLACASLLAIGAIGIEPGRSIPVLTNSLRDARAAVRSAGLQAFGGFKEERELLIPVAQQALGDSSLQVRASASNFVFTATNQAGVQHRAEENLKPDAL